jgi:hypothetical protein
MKRKIAGKPFFTSLLVAVGILVLNSTIYHFLYYPTMCIQSANPLDPYDCIPGAVDVFMYLSITLALLLVATSGVAALMEVFNFFIEQRNHKT